MKRVPGLVELEVSRRQFCTFAGATAVLVGCSGGSSSGPADGGTSPDSGGIDAGSGSSAGACGGAAIDVGAGTAFTANKPVYFSSGRFFVVRDSTGLYAVSASCTHQGATCIVSGTEFFCPRHGATFNFNGDVLGGPTSSKLPHYAMCTLANGHLGVLTSSQVAETMRYPG